jgi:hypothetical protein
VYEGEDQFRMPGRAPEDYLQRGLTGRCHHGSGAIHVPLCDASIFVPNVSLTTYDAASSHRALNLMFIAVVVFLPDCAKQRDLCSSTRPSAGAYNGYVPVNATP